MRLAYEKFIATNLFVNDELVSSGTSDIFKYFILPAQQSSTICASSSRSSKECFNDVLDKMTVPYSSEYSLGKKRLIVSLFALYGQNFQLGDDGPDYWNKCDFE